MDIPVLDYEHGEGLREFVVHSGPAQIAENTLEISLEKPIGFVYHPGDATKWYERMPDGTFARRRTFSFVSAPHEQLITFAYRKSDSDFKSQYLAALKPGDTVYLRAPQTEMLYPRDSAPLAMLAGGIGITPFVSMLRHAAHTKDRRTFLLLYASPSPTREAYGAELDALTHSLSLTIVRAHSDAGQYIDADALARVGVLVPKPHVYIAGPEAMVSRLKVSCIQSRIVESRIQVSSFTGYAGSSGFD